MLLGDEREQVVAYARRMRHDELTVATSGNVSVRRGDLVAITPSGVEYDALTAADVCVVDPAGRVVDGELRPSTELPMHTTVYRELDAGAVVHTHPLYATAVSTITDRLPAIHYLVALLGGTVRVAPYATYGSQELADGSVAAMADGRSAVLLANHGATTIGASLGEAYTRSVYLEWLCRLYHQASLLGEPSILPGDEIERVAERLRSYGQQDRRGGAG